MNILFENNVQTDIFYENEDDETCEGEFDEPIQKTGKACNSS